MNLADRRGIIRTSQSKRRIMPNLTLPISEKISKFLTELAMATERSEVELGLEAVQQYIDYKIWKITEINKALGEADQGVFATEEEVNQVFAKWR